MKIIEKLTMYGHQWNQHGLDYFEITLSRLITPKIK